MASNWLTREQAADRLSVTPRTVTEWCQKRGLRYAKIGNLFRLKEEWIDEFLEAQEARSTAIHESISATVDKVLAEFSQ